jgi:hypothetical protein
MAGDSIPFAVRIGRMRGESDAADSETAITAPEAGRPARPGDPEATHCREIPEAFMERLFKVHYAAIWRLLCRLGVQSAHLDDAAQEVFWVAARKLAEIRPGSEHAFLYGVAIRIASQEHRRRRGTPQIAELDALARLRDLRPSPHEQLEQAPSACRARCCPRSDGDRAPHRLRPLRTGRAGGPRRRRARRHPSRYGQLSTSKGPRGVLGDREARSRHPDCTRKSAMSFIDRGDEEFERTLLRSASGDVPAPEASERAWARFAALMAGVALALATTGVPAPFAAATPGRRFAGAVAAVKKLAMGAIGGSVVTLALVGRHAVPARSIAPSSTIPSPSVAVAPLAHAPPSAWDPPEAIRARALPRPCPRRAIPVGRSANETAKSPRRPVLQGPARRPRRARPGPWPPKWPPSTWRGVRSTPAGQTKRSPFSAVISPSFQEASSCPRRAY